MSEAQPDPIPSEASPHDVAATATAAGTPAPHAPPAPASPLSALNNGFSTTLPPPLPPISMDGTENPTDYTTLADSLPLPATEFATAGTTAISTASINAPTPVSAPVSTPAFVPPPMFSPGSASGHATAPPSAFPPAPLSASSPVPPPAHISAPVSTPTPTPPASVATSTAIPSPPTAHAPLSMPAYGTTVNATSPTPPSMQQQPSTGSPLQSTMPPMQPMGQYSPAYSPTMAQMGMQGGQMSYQLPGNARSRAHQREVKRRTKTGCLTCRKRRIKCDEGHPVCRNCVKSKRECLGYDPVFRQQAGPSDIRPASNSQPSLVVNPQENHNNIYPSAPPGYIPASAQPFAPSVQSDSSIQSFDQSNSNRQGHIEPSIEESDTMSVMASVQDTMDGSISQPMGTPDLSTPALMPLSGQIGRQEKVNIQDLLALQGIAPPPPYPIVPIQQARLDQIQTVYLHTYAPAIDRFLETRWFRDKGLSQLLTNAQLMAQYSALIDAFNDPKIDDPAVRGRVESFEASVVWDTMSICRSARNLVRNGNTEPMQEYDLLTTANRFDILEALITDGHLKDNPLREDIAREPPPNPKSLQDQLRSRSLNFWNCIGHFLTLHDNEASSAKEIDDTLASCRALLDQIENRDVIYSMAIGRHLGQRLSDFHPRNRPETSSDERNANTKLLVAQRFIEDESKDKGTTQVVKRLCGMVHRLWELKNILLPRA